MVLSTAALLDERYSIRSILGEVGPFDVTYLAWDLATEQEVVIREYYPVRLARRSPDGLTLIVHEPELFEYGLTAYSKEAELLARLDHPHVVDGVSVFHENGTVYRVSRHVSGASLKAYLNQLGDRLEEEEALDLLKPILTGLHAAHKHRLYHGGLSPKSVFITDNDTPVLLNFQMARVLLAQRCGSIGDVMEGGFAPPEQAVDEAGGGVAWDVFSAAAVFYYMLTGRPLPVVTDATHNDRMAHVLTRTSYISGSSREVLARALAFEATVRPGSIRELHRLLQTATRTEELNSPSYSDAPRVEVGFDPTPGGHEERPVAWTSAEEADARDIEVRQSDEMDADVRINERSTTRSTRSSQRERSRSVPTRRDTFLPRRSEDDEELEALIAQMARRQSFVSMAAFGIVVLVLGIAAGLFFGPALIQRYNLQLPSIASAQPDAEPNAAAASPLAPAVVETPVDGSEDAAGEDAAANLLAPVVEDEDPLAQPAESIDATTPSAIAERAPQTSAPDEAPRSEPEEAPPPPAVEEETEAVPDAEEEPAAGPSSVTSSTEPSSTEPSSGGSSSGGASAEGVPDAVMIEDERQYQYLRGQGDLLFGQGQIEAALERYESALAYRPDDADLSARILAIRDSMAAGVRAALVADSIQTQIARVTDENGIFIVPDTPPQMIDEASVRAQIEYPSRALRLGVQGRVTVRMVVDENGRMNNPVVVQGIGSGCDKEVLRVLGTARFTPAGFNGTSVSAWYMFTIVFSLDEEE